VKQTDDVMGLASGRWPNILAHFGADEATTSGKHSPCPMCGGKDRFRMIKLDGPARWICNQCGGGDGMDLLMNMLGCDFKAAAKKLRPIVFSCTYQPPTTIKKEERKRRMKQNVEVWQGATELKELPTHNTLGKYMAFRGLLKEEYSSADLRLHSGLKFYNDDGKPEGLKPAMLARVSTRDGKMALIHRTYLDQDKDGAFKTKKKMTAPGREWKGGCIRLFSTKNSSRIILAEGVETALSVRAIVFRKHGILIPCWACVNANAMENVALPDHITSVMVGSDNDSNFTGQKAAYSLANRLTIHDKRKVQVVVPADMGTDFNDELGEM
jgi:putative DNA primase/helicase